VAVRRVRILFDMSMTLNGRMYSPASGAAASVPVRGVPHRVQSRLLFPASRPSPMGFRCPRKRLLTMSTVAVNKRWSSSLLTSSIPWQAVSGLPRLFGSDRRRFFSRRYSRKSCFEPARGFVARISGSLPL